MKPWGEALDYRVGQGSVPGYGVLNYVCMYGQV